MRLRHTSSIAPAAAHAPGASAIARWHANVTIALSSTTPSNACRAAASSCASAGWRASIAQVGHTVAHVPHPTHSASFTTSTPSRNASAPDVHATAHCAQLACRCRTRAHRSECTASPKPSSLSKRPMATSTVTTSSIAKPPFSTLFILVLVHLVALRQHGERDGVRRARVGTFAALRAVCRRRFRKLGPPHVNVLWTRL